MDTSYLFAAFVWGTVGMGFFIYGKKRKRLYPLIGGILLMAASYFAKTWVNISIVSCAIIVGIYVLKGK